MAYGNRGNDRDRRGRPATGEFGGDYARDEWREDLGGDYARDSSRRGLGGDYARDPRWGSAGARGDYFGSTSSGRGSSYLGFGPAQGRGTFGGDYRGFGAADAVYGGSTGPANFGMATEFGGPANPAEWQSGNLGGSSAAYGAIDPAADYRGRGPKNYRRSDARISEEVNERLTEDAHVDATNVEVTVSDGEVTLNGSVPDRFMKRRAEDIAEACFGVLDVHNHLRVAGSLGDAPIGKAGE